MYEINERNKYKMQIYTFFFPPGVCCRCRESSCVSILRLYKLLISIQIWTPRWLISRNTTPDFRKKIWQIKSQQSKATAHNNRADRKWWKKTEKNNCQIKSSVARCKNSPGSIVYFWFSFIPHSYPLRSIISSLSHTRHTQIRIGMDS